MPIWSKMTLSVCFSLPSLSIVLTKLLPKVEYSHEVRMIIVLGHVVSAACSPDSFVFPYVDSGHVGVSSV